MTPKDLVVKDNIVVLFVLNVVDHGVDQALLEWTQGHASNFQGIYEKL